MLRCPAGIAPVSFDRHSGRATSQAARSRSSEPHGTLRCKRMFIALKALVAWPGMPLNSSDLNKTWLSFPVFKQNTIVRTGCR